VIYSDTSEHLWIICVRLTKMNMITYLMEMLFFGMLHLTFLIQYIFRNEHVQNMHEIWGGTPTKIQLSVLVEYKAGIYVFFLPQALVARTYHHPFSNFLFTILFSIKFLYFFIISSPFPYFNLFVSIFIQTLITFMIW
jgi:hypothetical protein